MARLGNYLCLVDLPGWVGGWHLLLKAAVVSKVHRCLLSLPLSLLPHRVLVPRNQEAMQAPESSLAPSPPSVPWAKWAFVESWPQPPSYLRPAKETETWMV